MSIYDALKDKGSTGGRNIEEAIRNLPEGGGGGETLDYKVFTIGVTGGPGGIVYTLYDGDSPIGYNDLYTICGNKLCYALHNSNRLSLPISRGTSDHGAPPPLYITFLEYSNTGLVLSVYTMSYSGTISLSEKTISFD